MAFKQDEDFLRYISMGAAGSAAVSRHLREVHGHRTIELERYAMANKLWTTKIKRLRLADLVCLDCGRRVEARAKSDLKVRMSHSHRPGREWDAGLRDGDLCAFVPWKDDGPSGQPTYFTVGAMRRTAHLARLGQPKAASEGAERDMVWPARVATLDGDIELVDPVEGKVRMLKVDGRRYTSSLPSGVPTHVYVNAGDHVQGGATFLVGCLDRPDDLGCPGRTWDPRADLTADEPVDRYAAVKAAGALGDSEARDDLLAVANNRDDDDRIRLEAWASLARIDPNAHTDAVAARANERASGDRHAMAMAMEAIFILSELGTDEAADSLEALAANRELDSEARCAAVWGLGLAGANDAERVLQFIADDDSDVALHALAGVGPLSDDLIARLAGRLGGTDVEGASAATLMARQGRAGIATLLDVAAGGGAAAVWAAVALGELPEAEVLAVSGGSPPDSVARRLEPLWALGRSWLRRNEPDTPLAFLERQTIRHLG